ncbi:MAG: helix-turn-helix domain-containing protein [Erythrobacter sp.]|nr:helix-turn-helix domain-containing protein [Erythrobacter sp.]
MAIKAHLDSPSVGDSQRSVARRALRLEASGLGPDGGETNVTIHNISAAGLLIETALDLATGEQFALDLPEAGIVATVVVWRSEQLYGCAFERALGPAALAAAQLQGMSPPKPAPTATYSPQPRSNAPDMLGIQINRLRREAGLTLADVAAVLGVSKPTVWAWEKGKSHPLPERLNAIAAALGVEPAVLAQAAGSTGASSAASAVIEDCRTRIAAACGTAPDAVRIMIEL